MRNGLTKANGIHVVIEDRDKSPSILSNGISVQPGAETNIGLKKTTISRLKAPFDSDCKSSYLMEEFKQNSFLTLFEYSSKNCKSWCYIEKILEECSCFDHTLMEGVMVEEFLNAKQKYNFTFCDTTSGSHHGSDCVNKVLFTEDQEALIGDCFCGSECKETEYRVSVDLYLLQKHIYLLKYVPYCVGKGSYFSIFQTQISTASWPSDGYWPKLLDRYNFTIYNWTFNYNEYIDYVMSEKDTDEIQQNVDLMRNYVKNNYVKVGKVKTVFTIFVNSKRGITHMMF